MNFSNLDWPLQPPKSLGKFSEGSIRMLMPQMGHKEHSQLCLGKKFPHVPLPSSSSVRVLEWQHDGLLVQVIFKLC